MGCASSSPFITTAGNGALKTANDAATKVMHSGEEAITEMKDSLGEKVHHVKDAIVGAAHNVGHEVENAFHHSKKEINETENKIEEKMEKLTETMTNKEEPSSTTITAAAAAAAAAATTTPTEFKIIPLKDPNDKIVEEALDEIASTYDDTTAELKNESENIMGNLINNTKENANKTMENAKENIMENILTNSDNTDMQSIDSLKTSSPDPEIEKILSNDKDNNPPTPIPTISELEKLHLMGMNTVIKMEDDIIEVKENITKNVTSGIESIEKEINTAITNT